jgi:TetR/AcrR family transcriptional repressor of mexJK operon
VALGAVAIRRRGGRPKEDDKRRNSETLLEVAATLFVERGFNGTTMEAVAQAAGLGKQALYMRYPDKEGLFMGVFQRLKDDEVFQPLPVEDGLPLAAGLRHRLRSILANVAGPRPMLICKLAVREGHRFPDMLRLLTEETAERHTKPLAEWLAHRRQRGELKRIDCAAVAAMSVDLLFAEIQRSMFRDKPLTEAEIDAHAGQVAGLVLAAIAA